MLNSMRKMNGVRRRGIAWKLVILSIFIFFLPSAIARRGLAIRAPLSKESFYYNETLARIAVQYASAVYENDLDGLIMWSCSRCGGLTKGFQVVELIVDIQHCLQAFVGVAEDLRAIVIAFRGTQENSIQNWVADLYFKQLDLNYPGVPGAAVHRGFYNAYHNSSLGQLVVESVKSILAIENDLKVIVIGHSMGGAMAAFCALDLARNYDLKDIQVITFGQPRVGNSIFTAYYSTLIPNTYRITHGHDFIPHLPPYYTLFPTWTYHHFPREIWIHKPLFGEEIHEVCDSSGEDPSCSRSVFGNSIKDHLCYMGVDLEADSWSSCGFVLRTENLSQFNDGILVIHQPLKSPWMNATKSMSPQI